MRMAFWQHLAVLALFGIGVNSLGSVARAAQFEHQETEQERFIVLAAPGGELGYKLLILEQIKSDRPCWSETGSNPSNVEPLLLNFDFTGICSRLVDSNGFSIRTAGVDQALQYSLRVIRKDNDLVLVAASNTEREAQVEIGRTNGIPTGFSRIVLDPGWRLTRRAYNGRTVGHIYLTYDQPMEVLLASARRSNGSAPLPAPTTLPPTVIPAPAGETNVIPVPSLPLGSEPAAPVPPPIETPSPTPAPLPVAPQSRNPNLSTILPPPPPALPPADTSATPPTEPTLQPATGGSLDQVPDPSRLPNAATESAPPESAPPESATAGSATAESTTARSSANQTGNTAAQNAATSRVPTVSSSGGALLRPRTQRQDTAAGSTARSTSARSTSNTTPSSTSRRSSAAAQANSSDRSPTSTSSDSAARSDTVAQAGTYQVIVIADNAETQDKVRSLAPSAFLTTINGQVVMQVGVFRDRQEADRLQQRLSLEGLPTAVIPVR